MSALTNYAENKVLDHALGTTSWTMPTQLYIGLATSSFGEAATTGSGVELSGSGYARQSIDFDAASGGTCDNSAAVEFPAATGSWGTVTSFALFDASTNGNAILYGDFSASKTIASGDILRIAAGDLDVTAA